MRFFGLNIWQLMMKIDGLILSLLNIIIRINNFFRIKQRKLISSNNVNIGKKRDIFIVLNGPSIVNQDLTSLKNKSIMFVNRGFQHDEYKRLQPEFHVFTDAKILTGEWSISWIDEIITMVPTITFIMPDKWAFHEKFKPSRDPSERKALSCPQEFPPLYQSQKLFQPPKPPFLLKSFPRKVLPQLSNPDVGKFDVVPPSLPPFAPHELEARK